jgi:hypothetical protein
MFSGLSKQRMFGVTLSWVTIVAILFPPIHLAFANGNIVTALAFFLGSDLLIVVSLLILNSNASAGE